MIRFLLVTNNKDSLSELAEAVAKHNDVELSWADSGEKALGMLSDTPVDLVVTDAKLKDMAGLELAAKLLSVNPMINCAAISQLSPEKFHEASEGLGILAQLPTHPGDREADDLVRRLKDLKNLTAGISIGDK